MRTTSLELSKKLREAFPEWKDRTVDCFWHKEGILSYGDNYFDAIEEAYPGMVIAPTYSTDFLLDKLVTSEGSKELGVSLRYVNQVLAIDLEEWLNKWIAFHPWLKQKDYCSAATPAEALGNLALALKEKGLL